MTQPRDVAEFIEGIEDERKREDSRTLIEMMKRATGETPRLWGPSIVGFGDYHYEYKSGRKGDTFRVGFSPRKQSLTLYTMGYIDRQDPLLAKLGKYTTGKACIYVKRLEDIDVDVLESIVKRSYGTIG
jgi:hypothetical protein